MSRRRRLVAGLGLGAVVSGLASCIVSAPPAGVATPTSVPDVVSRRFDDVTVHVVNTGWVRVKEAHRTLMAPVSMRIPSILFGRQWTELMPILVGVIEHPEGVFLVDAGASEETLDPDHFACDPGNAFVYRHLLDFRFAPEQRIDRRLRALGIDLGRVRGVVLTHRHADHADGLAHLPRSATVYVGAGDWPSHAGALVCRWPRDHAPELVPDRGPSMAAFPASRALTRDGRLAIVPLTGHSPGHLGLLLRTSEGDVVFAGDAAFDVQQVETRTLAGIVEAPDSARRTLEVLAAQIGSARTYLLFAHDPAAMLRLRDGVPTVPRTD